ncbi:hypothetical protein LSAT2_026995 [Lamellibrachia satsuma]|nr:hypothetical protein LSAT2_026995 [Lamellibrachia satsuma]
MYETGSQRRVGTKNLRVEGISARWKLAGLDLSSFGTEELVAQFVHFVSAGSCPTQVAVSLIRLPVGGRLSSERLFGDALAVHGPDQMLVPPGGGGGAKLCVVATVVDSIVPSLDDQDSIVHTGLRNQLRWMPNRRSDDSRPPTGNAPLRRATAVGYNDVTSSSQPQPRVDDGILVVEGWHNRINHRGNDTSPPFYSERNDTLLNYTVHHLNPVRLCLSDEPLPGPSSE